MFYTKVNMQFQ